MPRIFLGKTDQDRRIAEAVRAMSPGCEVVEAEKTVMVSSTGIIRVSRSRLEQALGEPLADDDWRQRFARATGDVRQYDEREYVIEEEPPGDY